MLLLDCFHMSFQSGAVFCSSQEIRGFPCQETANWMPELEFKVVTVRGHGVVFSIVHLSLLTDDSPFMFTVLVIFFTNTFRYVVW